MSAACSKMHMLSHRYRIAHVIQQLALRYRFSQACLLSLLVIENRGVGASGISFAIRFAAVISMT
jgi:hypothetical protein